MPEPLQMAERPVKIHILGRVVEVPSGLTIMKAMEYAGFRLVHGVGCRGGFCGACSTLYRRSGDYKLRPALACQTTVEGGMFLSGLPFVPARGAGEAPLADAGDALLRLAARDHAAERQLLALRNVAVPVA